MILDVVIVFRLSQFGLTAGWTGICWWW